MKKKLTVPDMFYIEYHKNKPVVELAKIVNVEEKLIKKYISGLSSDRPKDSDFGTTQKDGISAIDKYARSKGAVVCSEAVSQYNDDQSEKNRGKS